jgi:hypothetical protein
MKDGEQKETIKKLIDQLDEQQIKELIELLHRLVGKQDKT